MPHKKIDTNFKKFDENFKKSLTQEVRQKSDILERRSKD